MSPSQGEDRGFKSHRPLTSEKKRTKTTKYKKNDIKDNFFKGVEQMLERFFRPLRNLKRIEATAGGDEIETFQVLHIRPAEAAPRLFEPIIDAASMHVQTAAQKVGIELPDVRFRIITDPHTDEIPGTHFGTQECAINKAEMILHKRG